MAAWRCLLRQVSDVPAPWRCLLRRVSDASPLIRSSLEGWRQRPAARMTARFLSSDLPGSGPDLQPAGRKPNRRRRLGAKPATKRHLYVAVDDHDGNGFAIHKLDDLLSSGSTELLPPPLVRAALSSGLEFDRKPRQFATLGSSIVATGLRRDENYSIGATVIYDTDTAVLTVSDHLPHSLCYGADFAVAARNRLYLLESYTIPRECCSGSLVYNGGVHYLKAADPNDDDDRPDRANERWRRQPLPDSSQFSWSSKVFPPGLPFDARIISAHAVHPRGRTIFVSSPSEWKAPLGTFAYSTETGRWTRCGEWLLPFNGPAHYDHDLNAWVGLYLDPQDKYAHLEPTPEVGYLRASRVMTARASHPPEWKKVSIQELSSEDHHVKVQLLYMRERGEYCLVQHVDRYYKLVLRLTVFRLNYNENGELVITVHLPARSYEILDGGYDAQVFWM